MIGPAQFCTLFDRNYLVRGLALIASLRRHAPESTLWILALDDTVERTLRRMALDGVRLLDLPGLESQVSGLHEAAGNRSRVEYYFTLKPFLIEHVLDQTGGSSPVAYLDSDLYFFSPPGPLMARLEHRAALLTPHRFSPGLDALERFGRFNAGFIAFSPAARGREALAWWRDRCREWCRDVVEEERFGDQKYLNTLHNRFPEVEAVPDRGANLAPWNVAQYRLRVRRGAVYVEEDPLLFFHFHMFRRLGRWTYGSGLEGIGAPMTETLRRRVFEPYIADLQRADVRLRRIAGFEPIAWGTIRQHRRRDAWLTTLAFVLRGKVLLPGRPHRFWAGLIPARIGHRLPPVPGPTRER